MERHKMDFFMKSEQLREELKNIYPNGIYTLDLIKDGKRTATTRSHPIGVKGEQVILYNSGRPECGEITVEIDNVEQLDIHTPGDCEAWSRKEGWSVEYLQENPELKTQYQTTFHVTNKEESVPVKTASEIALLEEYKSCDALVGRLDTLIWQMASIVFPITLAGLSYFGVSLGHSLSEFAVVAIVGYGAIALLLTWYFLAQRWYRYQQIAFFRMREIETITNMWHYRYAGFLRLSNSKKDEHLEKSSAEENARLIYMSGSVKPLPNFGLRRSMAIVTAIFIIGWMALIILEGSIALF